MPLNTIFSLTSEWEKSLRVLLNPHHFIENQFSSDLMNNVVFFPILLLFLCACVAHTISSSHFHIHIKLYRVNRPWENSSEFTCQCKHIHNFEKLLVLYCFVYVLNRKIITHNLDSYCVTPPSSHKRIIFLL